MQRLDTDKLSLPLALRHAALGGSPQIVQAANRTIVSELAGFYVALDETTRRIFPTRTIDLTIRDRERRSFHLAVVDSTRSFVIGRPLPRTPGLAERERREWHEWIGQRLGTGVLHRIQLAHRATLVHLHDRRDELLRHAGHRGEVPLLIRRELESIDASIRLHASVHQLSLTEERAKHVAWAVAKEHRRGVRYPLNTGRVSPQLLAWWFGTTDNYIHRRTSQINGELFDVFEGRGGDLVVIDDRPYDFPQPAPW